MSIENILKHNNLRLYINPESINPGPNLTFLHTDALGVVNWVPFTADKLQGGNDGDIIRKVAGIWMALPQIENSNLPDPLQVNQITGITSVSTANLLPADITDTSASIGTPGQFLQKSNPLNALIWGPAPSIPTKGRIQALRGPAYSFPTVRADIVFNSSTNATNFTLVGGRVQLNNSANMTVKIRFHANVTVSDSSTEFIYYICTTVAGPVTTLTLDQTPQIQAAAINKYLILNTPLTVTLASNSLVFVQTERVVGAGTMSVNSSAGGATFPLACTLYVEEV